MLLEAIDKGYADVLELDNGADDAEMMNSSAFTQSSAHAAHSDQADNADQTYGKNSPNGVEYGQKRSHGRSTLSQTPLLTVLSVVVAAFLCVGDVAAACEARFAMTSVRRVR